MKLFLITVSILLLACTPPIARDEDFFFPVKEFFIEKTDVFINLSDTTEKICWKMKAFVYGGDTLLQTRIYDNYGRITDSIIERTEDGNSYMQSYIMFDYKGEEQIPSPCLISSSKVFKRNQKIREGIKWEVNFKSYASGDSCSLSKIRTLVQENDSQKIFIDHMNFMNKQTLKGNYHYSARVIYQKNKGLVAYTLKLPDGKDKKFTLENRNE